MGQMILQMPKNVCDVNARVWVRFSNRLVECFAGFLSERAGFSSLVRILRGRPGSVGTSKNHGK